MTSLAVRRVPWDDPAPVELRAQMDAEIRPRYADLFPARPASAPAIDAGEIVLTLVAFDGAVPAGTVSLKRTDGLGEVKRVFVAEPYRRLGLAKRLLDELEAAARDEGYDELVLETGERQPEAIALYEREGWTPIGPFGPYDNARGIGRYYRKALAEPARSPTRR